MTMPMMLGKGLNMSSNNWIDEAKKSIKDGYEKKDKEISDRDKVKSLDENVKDGATTGAVEGTVNPIRWIGGIFS